MPLLTLIHFMLPRWLTIKAASLIGALAYKFNTSQRQRLIKNYYYILGSSISPKTLKKTTKQAFKNLAIFYSDLLRIPVMKKRVVNLGELDPTTVNRVLNQGRGAILVTGHIGNWDLAGVFLSALGYPISAVVEPVPGGWMKTFNRYRNICAMETIPIPERERIHQALKKHRLLALVADRDLTGRGIICPAFGGRRSFPKGPAVYSLRYGIPIVVGYFVRQHRPDHPPYIGVIEGPIDFHPTGNIENDIVALTNILAKRINEIINRYPDQWLVFNAGWQ